MRIFHSIMQPRWLLIVIILFAFSLRIYRLDYQSLRGDESLSYIYGFQTLPKMFEIMRTTSPHPPVFYTTIHFWMLLAGQSEFALRYLALAASVLLTGAMYLFGKTVLNTRAGLVYAFLMSLNPYQIFYAQDARSYTLVTLLGLLATIALIKALQDNMRGNWILYGLFVTAGMYTHYYFLFIVVFQGFFVIWRSVTRRRKIPLAYFIVGGAVLLTYLPWLIVSYNLVSGFGGSAETVGLLEAVWRPLIAFTGGQFLPAEILWLLQVTIGIGLTLGFIGLIAWQKRPETTVLLALYLFVPAVGIFVASLFRPIFNERYLIIVSPAYIAWVGVGILWLLSYRKIWLNLLTALILLVYIGTGIAALNNYYHNPLYAKSPPWREVLNYAANKAKPGDALVYTSPVPSITYYNNERLPTFHIPQTDDTSRADIFGALESLLENYNRLWYLPAESFNPVTPEIEPWLNRKSVQQDAVFFRALHLNLYESPAYFLTTMTPQPTDFAAGIHLDGFRFEKGDSSPQKIAPGKLLDVTLVWHTDAPVDAAYTVFTHLIGPDGALYGQWDNPPGRGTYPTTQWPPGEQIFDSYQIPVQENAPPGEYRLFVGMYNSASGERLPVPDEAGNPIADHAVLSIPLVVEY